METFMRISQFSHKYGSPTGYTIGDKSLKEQRRWSARLLIEIGQSWPREDILGDFDLIPGTALHDDAEIIRANGIANAKSV